MRIIAENEPEPRSFYTGALGFLAPGRRVQFNVAIRTLHIDTAAAQAEYGTGGGIVWDSECAHEQSECRTKALILNASAEPFSLLETMLWTPGEGIALLEEHLTRLAASAEYFALPADPAELRQRLTALGESLPRTPHRVRLLVAQDGGIAVEATPFARPPTPLTLRVALAPQPVHRTDPFLYHKTTRRHVYEEAIAACPGFDDALLHNTDGEITESTRANVVAEIGGVLYTPPVRCGLLPGTLRQHLLDRGTLTERILTLDDIKSARRLFLANSLRGMQPALLVL
jgi:para-aminobenzoate synthetase/4-amino-4-deoxychorismate lyase